MSVDLVEVHPAGQHEHLQVVEQLRDLLGGTGGGFVLGRHPDLRRLLHDLLADLVYARLDGRHGPGIRVARRDLGRQFGIQRVERLHMAPRVARSVGREAPWPDVGFGVPGGAGSIPANAQPAVKGSLVRRYASLVMILATVGLLAIGLLTGPALAAEEATESHTEEAGDHAEDAGEHADESDAHEDEAAGFGTGEWGGLLLAVAGGALVGGLAFASSGPGQIKKPDAHH